MSNDHFLVMIVLNLVDFNSSVTETDSCRINGLSFYCVLYNTEFYLLSKIL